MAGSNATKSVLGELAKRVPSNQTKQFRKFLDLNSEYKRRVDKYPKELPRIDWDYYRTNVRVEAIKMVDEFEKKYEELNKIFDDRFKVDTRKYYDELEKQRAEVQVCRTRIKPIT
uniref:ATP synthase subunit d, mitochondrial n=1 Tax=Ceratitis capitata TaxID=7213 RepID=W8C0P7_CERCA